MKNYNSALNFILKAIEAEHYNQFPRYDTEMFLSNLELEVAEKFNLSHHRIHMLYKELQLKNYIDKKYHITTPGIDFIDKGGYKVVKLNFRIDSALKYLTAIALVYSAVFTYLNYNNAKEVILLKFENKSLRDSVISISKEISNYKTRASKIHTRP